MALTVIGRYDLDPATNGLPLAPIMPSEGVIYYRSRIESIRKAIYQVSDVSFATIPAGSRGDMIEHLNAILINNNYVSCENISGTVRWNFVDITTGTLVNVIGSNSRNWSGWVFSDGTNCISVGNIESTAQLFTSKVTPPVGVENTVQNAGFDPFLPGMSGQNPTFGYFNGEALGLGAGANFIIQPGQNIEIVDPKRLYYVISVNIATGAQTFVSGRGPLERIDTNQVFGVYGPSVGNGLPARMDYYNGYIYGCVVITNQTQTFFRVALWRFPFSEFPSLNTTPQYLDLGFAIGTKGTPKVYEHDALHINRTYGKIYFAQGPNMSVLRHGNLSTWPPTFGTALTLDPGTIAMITGIWTFPPFVYVAKTTGLATGGATNNQLIKILDTDLVAPSIGTGSGGREEEAYIMSILR